MNAADVIAKYERALGDYAETVDIKRGNTVATARAKLIGFRGGPIVGTVVQGESRIRVLVADLAADGLSLPILPTDKVSFRGQERRIVDLDHNTGRVGGVLIYSIVTVAGGT